MSQPLHAADPFAKIIHHEARTSLLGGQPLDGNYAPYTNTSYPPAHQPTFTVPPGGYHEREGFPTTLPPPVRRAPRMYVPNTKWTWSFMIIAILQAVVALCLESYAALRPTRFEPPLTPAEQICLWPLPERAALCSQRR